MEGFETWREITCTWRYTRYNDHQNVCAQIRGDYSEHVALETMELARDSPDVLYTNTMPFSQRVNLCLTALNYISCIIII